MNHMRLWAAAAIIALIVIAGFVLSVPHTRDVAQTETSQDSVVSVPSVTVHDTFKKGVHTITGSLEVPNACVIVSAQAVLVGDASSPEGILVALSLSDDGGVCLQVPTRTSFSATIATPARVPITATVNGVTATTTAL
ncbi:MAG: hypothetical protein Q8O94_00580 [bacterium]|nr:hypothetical protein [bacterium]